jgi:hypothetical protein
MIPLEDALGDTLRKMGLAEPAVMLEVVEEWDTVAGEPWVSRARPLYLRQGVLVVEAGERSAVGFLRYGVGDLERRLAERFGSDTIRAVEIRPPQRAGERGR